MAKKMSKKVAKKAAPKGAAALGPVKLATASKARSKGEFFRTIAENAGLSRQQVVRVFDVMAAIFEKDLSKSGPGMVNVPGMMRVTVKRMPATKSREGINPFTKEPMTIKAKPARNVVKVRPLKGLKALV